MPEQPKLIRKRIRSVASTRKITRTMEMVATAKLRVAQQRVQSSGPYLEKLLDLMRKLGASGLDTSRWPHFSDNGGKRTLLFVLTANRGLCGGYNANLIRLGKKVFQEKEAAGHDVRLEVAGKKGISAFRFQGFQMARTYVDELSDRPTVREAEVFLDALAGPFLRGEVDEVLCVYSHWISVGRQPPTALRFLPIAPEQSVQKPKSWPYFEPSVEAIVDALLPLYLRQTLFSVLAEAVASEQLARRTAMKAATDNAEDMGNRLTREYNKARQAQITKEIAEIIGGAEALQK